MFAKVCFDLHVSLPPAMLAHTHHVDLIALRQKALGSHLAPGFSGRSLTW